MDEKFLITSLKLLGDIIVQTAAIRSLRKAFPRARIVVLCDARYAEALATNTEVDEVWGIPLAQIKKLSGIQKQFHKTLLFFSYAWRIRKARFTRVVSMDRNTRACLWAFFSGAKIRGGIKDQSMSFLLNRKLDQKEGSEDYIDFYLKLARLVGGEGSDRRTVFPIPREAGSVRRLLPGIGATYFAIHPGASTAEKRWPAANWVKLMTAICAKKSLATFVLVCGPGEHALCEEIVVAVPSALRRRIVVFGERPLVETAIVFKGAKLAFCLDSASRHLAAAVGTPTITLMTKWVLPIWRLYRLEDRHAVVVSNPPAGDYDIRSIEVREVLAVFKNTATRG